MSDTPEVPARGPVPFLWMPTAVNVGVSVFLWALLCGWICEVQGLYVSLFQDFAMELPAISVLTLSVGDYLANRRLLGLSLLSVIAIADLLTDGLLVRTAQFRLRMLLLLFRWGTPVLLLLICVAASQIPLLSLLRHLK